MVMISVLRIKEWTRRKSGRKDLDWDIVIVYNNEKGVYNLLGRRKSLKEGETVPTLKMSFKEVKNVINFVLTATAQDDYTENLSITMYLSENEYTYEDYIEHDNYGNELFGFDETGYDYNTLLNHLNILKDMSVDAYYE